MPIYCYRCPVCGFEIERFVHKIRGRSWVTCKCGARMNKIISRVNTDLKENLRWSNSMGVNPRQIPEAMRLYPGSEYNSKGQLAIHNHKQREFERKRRGLVDLE